MTTVGVVTGAARGMGYACAERLLGTVDTLVVADVNEEALAAAADSLTARQSLRTKVEPVAVDITDAVAVANLAERVTQLGSLRGVAHAAGLSPTMADWRRVFAVDLVGTALLTEAFRPLATHGTAMVCFASIAPHLGARAHAAAEAAIDAPLDEHLLDRVHDALGATIEDPGAAYLWAKLGVARLVRREAVRWGERGARICAVSPGLIDTPMNRQEAEQHSSMAALVERTPLRRQGLASEVAGVVAFLLSAEASFVTGIDVPVDGGVLAAIATTPPTD